MKTIISIFFIFLAFPLSIFAQEVNMDSILVHTSEDRDITNGQSISIEELQVQIKNLKGEVKRLAESENDLKDKTFANERTIKEQQTKICRLEDKLIFADSIIARLSNDCLRKKYDAERVENAIANFERMYSSELKSKFGRLKELLTGYHKYTKEIEDILIDAQNDSTLRNPFTFQKQAHTYVEKIKKTSYYREVYDDNWTIPYLNELIDRSIEVVMRFNPKESKEFHLIDPIK